MSKITFKCKTCKKIVTRYDSQAKYYCSQSCYLYKPKVEKKCLICKKLFNVIPYRKNRAKYCSTICQYQAQSGKGNPFYGKVHLLKFKIRQSASKQKILVSEWNGFKSRERQRLMASRRYKQWRETVFKRDNYTCQECGQVGSELNADHIKSWVLYPELRFKISNGRTLCKECHKKTESYLNSYGRNQYSINL